MATTQRAKRPTYSLPSKANRLKWQKHDDRYTFEALQNGSPEFSVFPKEVTERWRRQVGRFTNQPRAIVGMPSKAGFYDPLSIMFVVDALLRLEPRVWIKASELEPMLRARYPWVLWHPRTVGRILAELAGIAREITNSPVPQGDPNRPEPIHQTEVGGINMWAVDHDPVSWQWLGAIRDWVGYIAEHTIENALQTGELPKKTEAIWAILWLTPWGAMPPISKTKLAGWEHDREVTLNGTTTDLFWATLSSMEA